MVEYVADLDSIFSALADRTRRDIVHLLVREELTVSEIASNFQVSLAAISKHIKVLEQAQIVVKHRRGKQQHVQLSIGAFSSVAAYAAAYQQVGT